MSLGIDDVVIHGGRARLRERFDAKWRRDEQTGCWLWTASLNGNGYAHMFAGRIEGRKRPMLAYRIGYELYVGPVEEGLTLDHLCRRRSCVNPWHLEQVTGAENTRRGDAGAHLAAVQAAKTHCPQGHPYSGANLYVTKDGSRKCLACTARRNRYHRETLRPLAATEELPL